MQILPDSSTSALGDVLDNAILSASAGGNVTQRDGMDFLRMLTQYQEYTPAEITPTLDTVAQDGSYDDSLSAVTEDPYIKSDTPQTSTLEDASAIPASEIQLTDAELQKVADSLRKDGVDEGIVQKIEALMGNPGGVTIGDIVKAVSGTQPAKLTEGDLVRIKSFTDKLDPSGVLSEKTLALLRDGNTTQAWTALQQAIMNADPDSVLNIERDEILSLGKALRLDDKTLDGLSKIFGGNEEVALSPEGLRQLLNPAQVNLAETTSAQEKLALALSKALPSVLKEARQRLALEAATTNRTARRVQQSDILIQDTVTKNGFVRQNTQPPTAEKESSGGTPDGRGEKAVEDVSQKGEVTDAGTRTSHVAQGSETGQMPPTNGKGQFATPAAGQSLDSGTKEGKDGKTGQDGKTGKEGQNFSLGAINTAKTSESADVKAPSNPWETLLQRLDMVQTPGSVPLNMSGNGNMAQASQGRFSGVSNQVLSQVEQGMLTAMRDGTRRLELQLNPLELGAVNVLLTTSRNGEVSALLRPERAETASLLMQQMDQIRVNLEEQGIKVEKVDVQTQLNDERGTTWQGMDQHNASQDEQSRSLGFDRLRRLNRVRGAVNDVADTLRPGSLVGAGSRGYTGSSLNLVA